MFGRRVRAYAENPSKANFRVVSSCDRHEAAQGVASFLPYLAKSGSQAKLWKKVSELGAGDILVIALAGVLRNLAEGSLGAGGLTLGLTTQHKLKGSPFLRVWWFGGGACRLERGERAAGQLGDSGADAWRRFCPGSVLVTHECGKYPLPVVLASRLLSGSRPLMSWRRDPRKPKSRGDSVLPCPSWGFHGLLRPVCEYCFAF